MLCWRGKFCLSVFERFFMQIAGNKGSWVVPVMVKSVIVSYFLRK